MKTYITKMRRVQAREITDQTEMVDCYNEVRVGKQGDFIVTDEYGKTMLMKREKFKSRFIEEEQSGENFNAGKWLSSNSKSGEQSLA